MRGADFLQRAWPLAIAASIAACHLAFFDAETRPIITDVRYFLYYAWRVTEGAVPHLDLFAVKTQLSVFVGALFHALSEAIGLDPLLGIRRGYLAIAALGAVLQFEIFRRIGGGVAAGLLGLAAYCSFGLLGELPAIGNVPKLMMAVSASAMALLVQRRHWVAAGVASAIAVLDWQVGALTGLAALVSALLFGGPQGAERVRAAARVAFGGMLVVIPAALFYASQGAFAATLRQIFFEAFARGSTSAAPHSLGPLERIANTIPLVCPEQEWLFVAGIVGMGVVAWGLLRCQDPDRRDPDTRGLLVPLAVQHYGVVGFSLFDIQGYADYMALLHSVAFFLGAMWVAVLGGVCRLAKQSLIRIQNKTLAEHAVYGALVIIAFAVARPGPWRPSLPLRAPGIRAGATLEDQRRVAFALDRLVGDGVLAALDHAELLFLSRRVNPLPVVYFNASVHRYFAEPGESGAETARRMLLSTAPSAFLFPRQVIPAGALTTGFEPLRLASEGDRYFVVAHLAKASSRRANLNEATPGAAPR